MWKVFYILNHDLYSDVDRSSISSLKTSIQGMATLGGSVWRSVLLDLMNDVEKVCPGAKG